MFVNTNLMIVMFVVVLCVQAVKAKGGIRRFCLDPNEYSDFEIANHLWSLMETGTYAASK